MVTLGSWGPRSQVLITDVTATLWRMTVIGEHELTKHPEKQSWLPANTDQPADLRKSKCRKTIQRDNQITLISWQLSPSFSRSHFTSPLPEFHFHPPPLTFSSLLPSPTPTPSPSTYSLSPHHGAPATDPLENFPSSWATHSFSPVLQATSPSLPTGQS